MKALATYPTTFEAKVGFDEVRRLTSDLSASAIGREQVMQMQASADARDVADMLAETAEMKAIIEQGNELPDMAVEDIRSALKRIRPEGTYLDERELLSILFALGSISALCQFFGGKRNDQGNIETDTPRLTARLDEVVLLPKLEQSIARLFDVHKRIADGASPELLRIRREMATVERAVSRSIERILRKARSEGWVEADAQPAIRDGRLTLPIVPAYKRAIPGIVQGESATGRTIFVEPAEVVEATNRGRELEGEERREIVRILTEATSQLRPFSGEIARSIELIGLFDFISAKARFAIKFGASLPQIIDRPLLSWTAARHPILVKSLAEHGRQVVPLDISLSAPDGRILLISGPNAGGKSVCLKTVGLVQYMLQCGMLPTVSPDSTVGIFQDISIDIGDEQSLEDDLSTYSSHLRSMKHFARSASEASLLLIDEFGSGTEPRIGGAIAEALLTLLNDRGAFGVITTHYHNLKTLAEETTGLVNGAMLYDRAEMKPLFRLAIGRPGSSFAIEIARKTGIPEEVITRASEIVGQDYIDMDKYLQDIVRDKRYWEEKRRNIRREEKRLEETSAEYASKLEAFASERKQIIAAAKKEAEKLIEDARSRIEGTIRTIKEAQAERDKTRKVRADLDEFRLRLEAEQTQPADEEDKYARELQRLQRRQANKQKRKAEKEEAQSPSPADASTTKTSQEIVKGKPVFRIGDIVRLSNQEAVGKILDLNAREAVVALGNLKMTVPIGRLSVADERAIAKDKKQTEEMRDKRASTGQSVVDHLYQKRLGFKTDIDLRGMRAAEAVTAVSYFIDDAIQLRIGRVRILHGTGSGALREAIRNYLSGVSGILHFADEHVQFGGAGITVVDLA